MRARTLWRSTGLVDYARRCAAIGTPVEIDLCPYAHASALQSRVGSGFAPNAFSNTYVCEMNAAGFPAAATSRDVLVRYVTLAESQSFVDASVAGFGAQAAPRSDQLNALLARMALWSSDIVCFVAQIDGRIAGSCGLAFFETAKGTIAKAGFALAYTKVTLVGRMDV